MDLRVLDHAGFFFRSPIGGATPRANNQADWQKRQSDAASVHRYFNNEEPNMSDKNSVVAIFDSHDRAEDAIRELQKSGFDMKKLSIVGKDYHTEENVVGYYNAGDRMKYWGKLGAFWGGFWGLLFGSAFFWVPGVGPVLVAGPLVACIVGGLEGAVMTGGLTALAQAFTAWAFRRTASCNMNPR